MSTSYRLKRKLFFIGPNGEVITGAEVLARKKQMNNFKPNSGSAKEALKSLKTEAAKNTVINESVRNETRSLNKLSNKKFIQMGKAGDKAGINALKNKNALEGAIRGGYKAGQASVGIKQGALNTWNRMGKLGKAGTVAAGVTAIGLTAKSLFGNRNKNNNQKGY